ncbi:1,4-beta-xylanase [Paenibacillus mucilaginosus]|uniref:endo-1,4-beta-xylanase n=1 Tax=Paenibacillus mucilaginosus TaxID=61624 RepID=UPI00240E5DAB|nr:endo-1,4-beta-xylanase [Paenibacillus mucilaginosus]WFA19382.1 1,4-beta-xylanase [Paenibacillus mucilaginosus]
MNPKLKTIISFILIAALLIPSGRLAPAAEAAAPDIPVLLYHRIVAEATDDWTHTSTAEFEKQMAYLSDHGYDTLSAEQYVDILEGRETPPDKPILLTFDDATPDFVTTALPILKRHGMHAVLFVVSDWIGGGYSMSTAQLEALAQEPGVSLQNHTKTHSNGIWTSGITKEQAADEIAPANGYLKSKTGQDPALLAYPYGAYNANAEAAAQENGIRYAFKVGYPNQGKYAMGRHYLKKSTTLTEFAAMVGGPAPALESAQGDPVTVYHEDFADGQGVAAQSGAAVLTPVTGKGFAGNEDGAALYVSGRTNNWDAADFKFSDMGLVNGKTYTVTASVYVDSDAAVPAGAQAYLQTIGSYGLLANVNYEAGQAITLTKEFTVDAAKDHTLRIQSNTEGASVPFYIGDLRITEKAAAGGETPEEPEPPRDPALPFSTVTFEDQTAGGFAGRAGTETLTVTNEDNHTAGGSYALKVEGRTNTWHGPALRVEKYVDKGYEYKVSVWVKLISPASSQLQLSTQVGSTSPSYNNILAQTISTTDGWVLYEGTYRYTNVSDEYLTIYMESSNNSTASFYIDDISFTSTGSGPVAIQKDLTPIQDAYRNDFLIGNAVSSADLSGVRLELLKMHHHVVTAENAMKPDAMQPQKGSFTFTAADSIVDGALAEGLQVHGHVLVWHQQTPAWMNTSGGAPLGREEALANLRTHIRTVMEHYGDKLISWDVVNEAMIDNPPNPADWKNALRRSAWYNAIGPDFVEQSYLAAREVLDEHPEWDIKLYYNDYNEDNANKAEAIYRMVKEINETYAQTHPGKLLIDGIGMQAHYNVNTNPENVRRSLEKFISLGVEVSITELDITAGSNSELSEQQAITQGYLYAQLLKLYKEHAAHIARVTFWGLNDATSWRSAQNPLLFDRDLQAKPAYYAVIDPDRFMEEHPPVQTTANQSTAAYGTPVLDGTVDAVWSQAPGIPVNRYQMAWQGASGTAKALWDDQHLYVLIQVSDSQLDKASANAYEQDSVEIFLDQNNGKSSSYQEDDGQYRVNFDNETSFNPGSIAEGFESAARVSGTNYTVEVKIPLRSVTPANDTKLGFDVQINDAKDGARQSVAAWNDTTGMGWQDTSVYGVLTLTGKGTGGGTDGGDSGEGGDGDGDSGDTDNDNDNDTDNGNQNGGSSNNGGSNNNGGSSNSSGSNQNGSNNNNNNGSNHTGGPVRLKPEVKTANGRATGTISGDSLTQALEQAVPDAGGRKQIVIELPKQADATAYEVQLPAQSLKGQANFELLLQTESAALRIPSRMLSGAAVTAEQVSIRVSQATSDHWDETTRERIGSRPAIELHLTAGGQVIPWNNPDAPVTVAFPYKPTAEELEHPEQIVVWYIDGRGSASPIPNGRYDEASGMVVFQTHHFSTYAAAYASMVFDDLESVPWAKGAIDAMAARNVIQGTAENRFTPGASIKRADFIALLVRGLELQASGGKEAMFSDVGTTAYYYGELAVAQELGIATGLEDHTFQPDSPISRQDMMVLTARALSAAGKQVPAGADLGAYSDAERIASYAKDSASALVQLGVVNGKDGAIAPNDPLTRAEAAVILYRIWKL